MEDVTVRDLLQTWICAKTYQGGPQSVPCLETCAYVLTASFRNSHWAVCTAQCMGIVHVCAYTLAACASVTHQYLPFNNWVGCTREHNFPRCNWQKSLEKLLRAMLPTELVALSIPEP
eukprot:1156860-Pelagomonas_calceolata.AAC.11